MLGVIKFFISVVGIEVVYYYLINYYDSVKFIQYDWQVKFEIIKFKMNVIDYKFII